VEEKYGVKLLRWSCHCERSEAIFLDRHVPIPSGLAMTNH